MVRPVSRRQITMNDLPVGRSVNEALRLVQAFQFTVSFFVLVWQMAC